MLIRLRANQQLGLVFVWDGSAKILDWQESNVIRGKESGGRRMGLGGIFYLTSFFVRSRAYMY
jgi:hypothetical protein